MAGPSKGAHHVIPNFKSGAARRDNPSNRAALHRAAQGNWLCIGSHIIHAPAHVGINRKIGKLNQNVVLRWHGHGFGFKPKMVFTGGAFGALG